jgi:hypothetical protein
MTSVLRPLKVVRKKPVIAPPAPVTVRDLARKAGLTVAQLAAELGMPIGEILSEVNHAEVCQSINAWLNEPGWPYTAFAKEAHVSYRDASVIVDGWRPYLTKSEYIVARFILDRTHRWSTKDKVKASERIPMRHFLEGVRDAEGRVWTEPCGLSERTIQRAINGLVAKSALTVSVVAGNQARVYALNLDWVKTLLRVENDLPK